MILAKLLEDIVVQYASMFLKLLCGKDLAYKVSCISVPPI